MTGVLPVCDTKEVKRRFAWLDFLRAIAVFLVVWDHFVGGYLHASHQNWLPNRVVNGLLFQPLGITQYGGFLGVCLFFLISGYIITNVATRETAFQFGIRRFLRIFPPLAVAVLLVVALGRLGLSSYSSGAHATFGDVLANLTLTNYFIGVAWTLVIEVTFYLETFLLHGVLGRRSLLPYFPLCVIAISTVFVATARMWSPGYFLFCVSSLYIPILALGSAFYLFEFGVIGGRVFVSYLALGWLCFLYGTHTFDPQFLNANASYPISAALALIGFTGLWLARDRFPALRAVTAIALTSYSIYLFHAVIGVPLLMHLNRKLGYFPSLLLTVFGTAIVVAASYFVIEKPSHRVAAWLSRGDSPGP